MSEPKCRAELQREVIDGEVTSGVTQGATGTTARGEFKQFAITLSG